MIKASHSEVESYLVCSRKHYYAYGLKIESRKVSPQVFKGLLGHKGLEAYYKAIQEGLNDRKAEAKAYLAIRVEAEKYDTFDKGTIVVETIELVADYIEYYNPLENGWEILEVELELDVEVVTGYIMPAKIDLIVRIPGRGIVAIDHKFVYDFMNDRLTGILPQLPKYLLACRASGLTINEIDYSEIRTRKNAQEKFRRSPVKINSKRLMRTIKEQIRAAKRIQQLKELPLEKWEEVTLRVGNSNICKSCPFTLICETDLREDPHDYLIETEYKAKERR